MSKTARAYLAAQAAAAGAPSPDDLVTSSGVRLMLGGIASMTLWRYREHLKFPAPDVTINRTNFWYRKTVHSWIAVQQEQTAGGGMTPRDARGPGRPRTPAVSPG
jgi:hypothetical protein